jgi:N-acetylglucosaminyldiphosphoundecaprenol N-acetyl-beta-D-mannosaminyltransferase
MSHARAYSFETVLGIRFLNAPASDAIALLAKGGLMVVPSAPVLTMLDTNLECRRALEASDFAIVDSAYLALLWRLLKGKRLTRVSGLEFIRRFVAAPDARKRGSLFLVNPTDEDRDANLSMLREKDFDVSVDECYTAPLYERGAVRDNTLLQLIEAKRPRYVLLNLGGGVQEPLGRFLKQSMSYSAAIICTGAAIAFLTGRQARISPRADAWGLGWLMRSLSDPARFVPRYLSSIRLASLVLKHGSHMPPTRDNA